MTNRYAEKLLYSNGKIFGFVIILELLTESEVIVAYGSAALIEALIFLDKQNIYTE